MGCEVVLEGFLCRCVRVEAEDVAEKVESASFEFLTDGSFFGEVVEILVANFLWVYVAEANPWKFSLKVFV